MKLEPPFKQYEGKWFENLPPLEGHRNAFIFAIRFIAVLDSLNGKVPTFEQILIPERHRGKYWRKYGITGEVEPYIPSEDDLHNAIFSIFGWDKE
jgi:hypothetical protein